VLTLQKTPIMAAHLFDDNMFVGNYGLCSSSDFSCILVVDSSLCFFNIFSLGQNGLLLFFSIEI